MIEHGSRTTQQFISKMRAEQYHIVYLPPADLM